jgi:hypothetical protein
MDPAHGEMAMSIITRAVIVALLPLMLAACFSSEAPLIGVAESVTPVAVGRYGYSESDEESLYILVTINGNVTMVTSGEEGGDEEVSTYLMRNLRDDYFIVMDQKGFDYSLIRVRGQQVDEFEEGSLCEKLQDLAATRGVDISTFGVVKLTKDDVVTCYFDDLEKLGGAFSALLDAKLLEAGTTYTRVN